MNHPYLYIYIVETRTCTANMTTKKNKCEKRKKAKALHCCNLQVQIGQPKDIANGQSIKKATCCR